mgnify:CR=1 FL=1
MTAADGAEITTEIIEAEDGGHEIIITAEDDPDDGASIHGASLTGKHGKADAYSFRTYYFRMR